jgi:hypothetical protein
VPGEGEPCAVGDVRCEAGLGHACLSGSRVSSMIAAAPARSATSA